MSEPFQTVDAYIASFPEPAQAALTTVRAAIRRAVPQAEETISYKMPTVTINGRYFIYYAGWKGHISLHAVTELPAALEAEVQPLRSGSGTVKLTLRQPVPVELVERIASHLAHQRTSTS